MTNVKSIHCFIFLLSVGATFLIGEIINTRPPNFISYRCYVPRVYKNHSIYGSKFTAILVHTENPGPKYIVNFDCSQQKNEICQEVLTANIDNKSIECFWNIEKQIFELYDNTRESQKFMIIIVMLFIGIISILVVPNNI